MSDEVARAAKLSLAVEPISTPDFSNVEFLETALSDPLNVIRAKLQDLSSLPEGVALSRVIIVSEFMCQDGTRALDVTWNEGEKENAYTLQDNLVAILSRVKNALERGE